MGLGMLPVGVLKENAARSPPHQCTLGSICGVFGLSFGCHFAPKGGGRGSISKHMGMSAVDV